jgi:ubiquinone/menaquinone biosynthesis C-methylase UbiE
MDNVDHRTVSGFGFEWKTFDQSKVSVEESERLFAGYFGIFPWDKIPLHAAGIDVGCGSGRWARQVAPRVGSLHCIDASAEALSVARENLAEFKNCDFHCASVNNMPIDDSSLDFGYSLGVLHHVPDTAAAIRSCVQKLKIGAPFLIYLYYALENRPAWFRLTWESTNLLRRLIARCPHSIRLAITQILASIVYYPLARISLLAEMAGWNVNGIPLSFYRTKSFYTMRTDALDRFGTSLEQRFTANQIRAMMTRAGLGEIKFSDRSPFWCAVGYRQS